MSHRILVVDDDRTTRQHILDGLREAGFLPKGADDGREALYQAIDSSFDALVLDRMLPGLNGLAVIAALRAAGVETPVLILSALDRVEDRVTGLTSGADDYLVKPFAMAELIARVRLLVGRRSSSRAEQERLICGDLEMDLASRKVRRCGRDVDLKPREFQLLEFFMRRRDEVVPRAMLLKQIWDIDFEPATTVLEANLSRLRKKIELEGESPLIHTVRGIGYKFGVTP